MSAVLALVVFVGVSGPDSGKIDRQVGALLHLDASVERVHVSSAQLSALGVPTRGPRLMRKLQRKRDFRGKAVVAGKVIRKGHSAHLRMVLYSSRGTMTDLLEVPIRGDKLDRKAIANLREVLIPAVQDLDPNAKTDDDAIEMDDDSDSPFAKSKPESSGDSADNSDSGDDESPFAKSNDDSSDSASADDSASDEPDDSSSADDSSSSTGGWDDSPIGPTVPTLGMRASIGLGFVARAFAGPEAIPAYSSTAVGSVRFSGSVQPTKTLIVHLSAERTLGMTTQIGSEIAPTTISRWEGVGSYIFHHGKVQLAAVGGLGNRSFVIESKAPMRSPDGKYTYLVTGAQAQASIGKRVSLAAMMAIEPVVAGAQPTRDAYGPARRWALEMAGALGVRVRDHVFVEARAEYQRFSWSWGSAGARGAGGASDGYPGATVSVGAQY